MEDLFRVLPGVKDNEVGYIVGQNENISKLSGPC